ncbi:MAG: chitobiase/beta-hexosaminidase C-terminal domain-containing protein, partial [Oscillospiraceae bacterium]|nr:chitobiase/beta-hexosaminidase C-terminal domain-containing protein [Oscillospiraceae bacterium]
MICLILISCETKNGDKTENPSNMAAETPHSAAGTLPGGTADAVPSAPIPDDSDLEEVTLTFSVETGFYNANQVLTIEVKGDYPVYYTLNGDMPSASGTLYTEGIPLTCPASSENVFVVRAAAFSGKQMLGRETTKTYILSRDIENRYFMPVISLVTDSENLYNAKTGILDPSNVGKKGREWERPVNVTFFEPDGSIGFSQDAGIRLQGNASRGIA